MKLSKGARFARGLAVASISVFVFMPLFRAFIYPHMYLGPDEPYGISDIIEFLVGCLFMFLVGLSVVTAIILVIRGNPDSKKAGGWLLGLCVLMVVLVNPLHDLAARWSI